MSQDKTGDNIVEFGQTELVKSQEDRMHCLTIIGQIEGHMLLPPQNKTTKYEHVLPQLVAIEQSDKIDGFLLVMNTVGGDVEAGLAIAEMIAGMKKPSVSLVLGGGHSIGIPLAVSAKRSIIAPTATMTVHPLRLNGVVVSVPQTYDYFNRMQDRVIRFVEEHSGLNGEAMRALMQRTDGLASETGTVLVGEEAVSCGLIDEVGGLERALEALRGLIEQSGGGAK